VVFINLKKLFKPIVIFFELTNSLVMLNKILQNLINIREVVSFINDVIIRMKEEKEHNEVSYIKSIHSENTFLQWYYHYNISNTSLSYMTAILSTTHSVTIM